MGPTGSNSITPVHPCHPERSV
ncbi:uncharacterized protein G2W53_026160 [Senna tora]|uniref:Uncharacterized protein n=1 Tax=Senna tora TaxID=362788 RepID=A0A834TGZ0_9FABA|nr:uncharacterized protein G2W53_026160 [Senna tora]